MVPSIVSNNNNTNKPPATTTRTDYDPIASLLSYLSLNRVGADTKPVTSFGAMKLLSFWKFDNSPVPESCRILPPSSDDQPLEEVQPPLQLYDDQRDTHHRGAD